MGKMVSPKLFFHKREQYVSMKVLLNSGAIRKSGNGNAQMIDALVCVLKGKLLALVMFNI